MTFTLIISTDPRAQFAGVGICFVWEEVDLLGKEIVTLSIY